jgi:CubicO group peptidase (beta-lactamase class C family)
MNSGRRAIAALATVLFWSLIVLVPAGSRANTCPDPEIQGFSERGLSRIGPAMQDYVDKGQLAGIDALLVRNGHSVFRDSWGYRNLASQQPMGHDSIFRIYSMSKPVTSVAVMMLVEERRLQLSDPVGQYLPEFTGMKVLEVGDDGSARIVDAKNPITVKHLLMHTSGLSYGFGDDEVDRRYLEAGVWEPGLTLEQVTTRVAALPLAHQPGAAWRYSVSTDILGRLVEVVSGTPLDEFMDTRIFTPLGMKDTGFFVPPEKLPRLAEIYGWGPEDSLIQLSGEQVPGVFKSKPTFLSGGGGLVSTSEDYRRFAQMLANKGSLNGVQLLDSKTVEDMTRNHLPNHLIPIFSDVPGGGFGLGFYVVVDKKGTNDLGSVGNYGWGGHASTVFWIDPVEHLVGVLLTQFIPSGFHRYNDDFRALVYQALIDGKPCAFTSDH